MVFEIHCFKMLTVIVFSKDRVWQLKECLRTLIHALNGDFKIVVLYRCGAQDEHRMEKLIQRFMDRVEFVKENHFEEDFNKLIKHSLDHVMFCVDDMIFYQNIKVEDICKILDQYADIFCVQMRLFPEIKYSHVRNKYWEICPPLLDIPMEGFKKFLDPALIGLAQISVDWNCPFDLSGGVYRKKDVEMISSLCKGRIKNPNVLECIGNQVVLEKGIFPNASCFYIACSNNRILSLITVNRVQNEFSNPVYQNLNSDQYDFGSANLSLESNFDPIILNRLLDTDEEFDLARYQTLSSVNSVHIPNFYLLQKGNI